MKKMARKFLAMLLTAAIAVSGMVMTTVSAGARGVFDDAVKISELEFYSKQFTQKNDNVYYKLTLPKSGQITIRAAEENNYCRYRLLNSNADEIYSDYFGRDKSRTIEKLEKGTYYLLVVAERDNSYVRDFYYTFTPDEKPTISFKVTIPKGSTLQLGSVVENYNGNVTWVSTKKTVATVSSAGKVSAKKAGTTTIRAQLDSGEYVQIKVVVTK